MINRVIITASMFVLAIIYSCTPGFKILQATDKFYPDQKTIYTTPISVKSSNPFDLASLDLQFGYTSSPDTSFKFFAFSYMGKNWAFLESLRILADGNAFTVLPSIEPKRDIISGDLVTEYLGVRFNDEEFSLIKNAKKLDVRVNGGKRSFDFAFDKTIQEYFDEFLKRINEK